MLVKLKNHPMDVVIVAFVCLKLCYSDYLTAISKIAGFITIVGFPLS